MKAKQCLIFTLFFTFFSAHSTVIPPWVPYDESNEIKQNAENPSEKLRYKHIQPLGADKNVMWANIAEQIKDFSAQDYDKLTPLIFNQDILTLQAHIKSGHLSYEKLTQWYLYRIAKYENNPQTTLNAVVALSKTAVADAKARDKNKSAHDHPLYGMPILLKDNVNAQGMPTTAGTYLLRNNVAPDAFIVEKIKAHGGIILGKTNLSEWANYLCSGCPNGYSAVGGQTLNPYGRKMIDTGGSSSGSGAAIAANYAAAAIGTETSGSILSPSSLNSLVGLKPTVGLLSRSGIVPLSSTLDTPGPMARNVTDAAILLSAIIGQDSRDVRTQGLNSSLATNEQQKQLLATLSASSLKGLRLGVNKDLYKRPHYKETVENLAKLGVVTIEFEHGEIDSGGFGDLLAADMKNDVPLYLQQYASKDIAGFSTADIIKYNKEDAAIRVPYGQGRFEQLPKIALSQQGLSELRIKLNQSGVEFFEQPMREHKLDAILSVNNSYARNAAMANYPCLTVPMGYSEKGDPVGLTFISRPLQEESLLKMAYAFEQATKSRVAPADFN